MVNEQRAQVQWNDALNKGIEFRDKSQFEKVVDDDVMNEDEEKKEEDVVVEEIVLEEEGDEDQDEKDIALDEGGGDIDQVDEHDDPAIGTI